MTIISIGLHHRSAPLEVLEQIAISADAMPKALLELTSSEFVNEAVVLSTCNRTEVYLHAERFHDAFTDVCDALSVVSGLSVDAFESHLYVHYADEAIAHLFHVTAGLDSTVLGEHEILGQVKTAFDMARQEGCAGPLLGQAFEHAVVCGKRVRTDTAIGRSTASLSHAAVSLVQEHYGSLADTRVLLIGAGDVGSSVATALLKSTRAGEKPPVVEVTNRTAERAQAIADDIGATVVDFADLDASLARADVIISATAANQFVLTADALATARADRITAALVLDLAVPRDVEPAVAELDGVSLLLLEDLQQFANRGIEARRREAVVARQVVAADIERYHAAVSAREVAPLIGSLHRWADDIRAGELERYDTRLGDLSAEQRGAIEAMTRAMLAKVLHRPSVQLKRAAGTRRGDRLAESARELFDLS